MAVVEGDHVEAVLGGEGGKHLHQRIAELLELGKGDAGGAVQQEEHVLGDVLQALTPEAGTDFHQEGAGRARRVGIGEDLDGDELIQGKGGFHGGGGVHSCKGALLPQSREGPLEGGGGGQAALRAQERLEVLVGEPEGGAHALQGEGGGDGGGRRPCQGPGVCQAGQGDFRGDKFPLPIREDGAQGLLQAPHREVFRLDGQDFGAGGGHLEGLLGEGQGAGGGGHHLRWGRQGRLLQLEELHGRLLEGMLFQEGPHFLGFLAEHFLSRRRLPGEILELGHLQLGEVQPSLRGAPFLRHGHGLRLFPQQAEPLGQGRPAGLLQQGIRHRPREGEFPGQLEEEEVQGQRKQARGQGKAMDAEGAFFAGGGSHGRGKKRGKGGGREASSRFQW